MDDIMDLLASEVKAVVLKACSQGPGAAPGNLCRVPILGPQPRPGDESESPACRVGPVICAFTSPHPGGSDAQSSLEPLRQGTVYRFSVLSSHQPRTSPPLKK